MRVLTVSAVTSTYFKESTRLLENLVINEIINFRPINQWCCWNRNTEYVQYKIIVVSKEKQDVSFWPVMFTPFLLLTCTDQLLLTRSISPLLDRPCYAKGIWSFRQNVISSHFLVHPRYFRRLHVPLSPCIFHKLMIQFPCLRKIIQSIQIYPHRFTYLPSTYYLLQGVVRRCIAIRQHESLFWQLLGPLQS